MFWYHLQICFVLVVGDIDLSLMTLPSFYRMPEGVEDQLRPLQMDDLNAALQRLKESKQLNPLNMLDISMPVD